MPDFDAIMAEQPCWNCQRVLSVEVQTKLHQGRRHRTLKIGDEILVGDPAERESFFYDIVLSSPQGPGQVNAAYDWRCTKCRHISWLVVRVLGNKLAACEALAWDTPVADAINLVDAGAATTFLFRDAGMDCWINQISLEVLARRKPGSKSVEPYMETLSNKLPGRFRTLLSSARFKSESPFKREEYVGVFAYNEAEIRRDLANASTMYRAYPTEFPRFVPAVIAR